MGKHIRIFAVVWAALLLLLAGTYAGAKLPLNETWSVISNLGFAAVKTVLVGWFFMHLNESGALTRIAAVAAPLFLFVMFYVTLADVLFRVP